MGIMLRFSLPIILHLSVVIPLSVTQSLNILEFLGLNFSVFVTSKFVWETGSFIYNTWLGVLLGHNVNLREMGSWAVVTGATDGIGLAYCKQLASRGINVILISRSLEKLEKCAALLESDYGVMTKVMELDFTGNADIYDRVDMLLQGMDIGTLINNVGMTYGRPTQFHDIPDSKNFIRSMINMNALAVTMMTRSVLPGMLSRGKGVVVNVGSVASCTQVPWYSLYSASKGYMDQLTRDLATEYKGTGIIFQYQLPAYVTTKLSKIKKPSLVTPTAEQFAKAGIESIGLQGRTAVWIPHRALHCGFSLLDTFLPKTFSDWTYENMRAFWLFAKKREFQKLNMVYTHKTV